jgi:HTH-type transcriptional regulator, quorum sensing regulator NprR
VASVPETVQKPVTLGERVRAARHELGLSQAQLAGEELTKGFISQVEAGLVRPSLRSLQIIAGRLGKGIEYFVGDQPLTSTKRVHYHRVAAEAAAERADWRGVRTEVQNALAHAPTRRERGKLTRLLVSAELAARETERAFEHIAEALSLLDASTDAEDIAKLHYLRGFAYVELGQLVAATESFEAARDIVERHEIADPRLRSRILLALGTTYRRLERTAKALATYESALALAARTSEFEVAARSHMGIAASLYDEGDLDGAIGAYERARGLLERMSDATLELSVLQSMASVSLDRGKLGTAREFADRCRSRALAIGDDRMAAVAETELARAALAAGDVDGALASAHHAQTILAQIEDDRQRASALRVIGAAEDARGDYAASDDAYRESIRLVTKIEHHADRASIATEYARKLRARGETESAYDMLELARGPHPKA